MPYNKNTFIEEWEIQMNDEQFVKKFQNIPQVADVWFFAKATVVVILFVIALAFVTPPPFLA